MKTSSDFKGIFLSKKSLISLLLLILLIGAVIFFFSRKNNEEKNVEESPTVLIEEVKPADVYIYGDFVGRVKGQQFVEVRARVEGYLQKMLFSEGTFVKKGQTLFVIDPTVYKARLNKVRAQLNKAKAQAQKASRDLARIRPLHAQNAASQLDLDNAEAAYETAMADVAVCQADLTQAEITLGYTQVKAPISGYISQRGVDLGTFVGPSATSLLATVVNSDSVHVEFSMTALDYLNSKNRNVTLGQRAKDRDWDPYVTVTLADGSIYPFKGVVDFADPQVDPKTGTFQVRAELPNPDRNLLPGEITKVKLLMDVRENAIQIPQKAITVEKGGAYVYVIGKGNRVEKRFVETGPEVDNNIIVERGLVAGEKIIVEGIHKLQHGTIVKISSSNKQ